VTVYILKFTFGYSGYLRVCSRHTTNY